MVYSFVFGVSVTDLFDTDSKVGWTGMGGGHGDGHGSDSWDSCAYHRKSQQRNDRHGRWFGTDRNRSIYRCNGGYKRYDVEFFRSQCLVYGVFMLEKVSIEKQDSFCAVFVDGIRYFADDISRV